VISPKLLSLSTDARALRQAQIKAKLKFETEERWRASRIKGKMSNQNSSANLTRNPSNMTFSKFGITSRPEHFFATKVNAEKRITMYNSVIEHQSRSPLNMGNQTIEQVLENELNRGKHSTLHKDVRKHIDFATYA